MAEAVIVEAVRTPIGKRKGALRDIHPVDLGAHVLKAIVERTSLDPSLIEDVIFGCVSQAGEQASNVARYSALAAGWPETVPGTTVDRACGSSQQALTFAVASVIAGHQEIVVAGGVESMTRVPMGSTRKNGPGKSFGPSIFERYGREEFSQGEGAEVLAERWNLSRTDLDQLALDSHARAHAATERGDFAEQIAPITGVDDEGSSVEVTRDQGIRVGGTLESLAKLKTVFKEDGGVITAGNSSQISDGAAALLVMTPEAAKRHGLTPIARVHTAALAAADPVTMLTAPIPATQKALEKSGLSTDDIGVYEVNEAFASVPAAWMAEIGVDWERVNPNGGAIALGHPLGGSGARIMTDLVHHMRRTDTRYGLQTMCEAGGQANATILELIRA